MTSPEPPESPAPIRLRREPPAFRRVAVQRVEALGPRLTRVTLAGPELRGFGVEQPAASVRLLLPPTGSRRDELVVPAWNGNEFLLPDGTRPTIRTFTPRLVRDGELDVDVVLHGHGAASAWAAAASAGDAAAVSGPGRGYAVDAAAGAFLLAGDETAIPAISQLLEALPPAVPVRVLLAAADPDARLVALPPHDGASVEWCDGLAAAIEGEDIAPGTRVWVAGEAAEVQRVRRHLFDDRGMTRTEATVRGYWKRGRAGDDEPAPTG